MNSSNQIIRTTTLRIMGVIVRHFLDYPIPLSERTIVGVPAAEFFRITGFAP